MKLKVNNSKEKDQPYDAPLEGLRKRLIYEVVAADFIGICSLDYRVVIAVAVPVFVDIAQAWIRTYRNLS